MENEVFAVLSDRDVEIVEALAARGTKTYEQIADELGMSRRHLQRVRKRDDIRRAVRHLVMENLSDEVQPVLSVLAAKAKKGDHKSIELFTKITGLYQERTVVDQRMEVVNLTPYDNMSPEAIEMELKKLDDTMSQFGND